MWEHGRFPGSQAQSSQLLPLWTPGPQSPDWAEPRSWRALSRCQEPAPPTSHGPSHYGRKCPGQLPCVAAPGWVPPCSCGTSRQPVAEDAPPPELVIALNLHTPACHVPPHTHLAHILKSSPGCLLRHLAWPVHWDSDWGCPRRPGTSPPKSPCSWAWTWLLGAAHHVPYRAHPAHRDDTPGNSLPQQ